MLLAKTACGIYDMSRSPSVAHAGVYVGLSAKDFEYCARDCMRLACETKDNIAREQLIELARLWMGAAMGGRQGLLCPAGAARDLCSSREFLR
jgi:hypothetical protein